MTIDVDELTALRIAFTNGEDVSITPEYAAEVEQWQSELEQYLAGGKALGADSSHGA